MNLFNKVVHFDDASGFSGYIESVEMYNYCRSISSGLIAGRMTYLCEKYKTPKRALGYNMNESLNEELFHVEMTSRTDTALDQLNHIIDTTFSSVETFEPLGRYSTLQSLYTALDHQLQDGLMDQQEFDRTLFIVRKLWDLKLQVHMIEKEGTQLSDVIVHIITLMLHLYSEGIITRSLFVCVCTHLYAR